MARKVPLLIANKSYLGNSCTGGSILKPDYLVVGLEEMQTLLDLKNV